MIPQMAAKPENVFSERAAALSPGARVAEGLAASGPVGAADAPEVTSVEPPLPLVCVAVEDSVVVVESGVPEEVESEEETEDGKSVREII